MTAIALSDILLPETAEVPPDEDDILELVSAGDMKTELAIAHTLHDVRIENAILEAYAWLDGPSGWLNRAILTQTWKALLPRFDRRWEIPLPPLQSITQMRHRDAAGNWTVTSTDIWGHLTTGLYGNVYLKSMQTWPAVHADPNPVEVTFVAGYGDADAVKMKARGIVKAIKLLAAHYYQNPSATLEDTRLASVPRAVEFGLKSAAGRYRIMNDHS